MTHIKFPVIYFYKMKDISVVIDFLFLGLFTSLSRAVRVLKIDSMRIFYVYYIAIKENIRIQPYYLFLTTNINE